MASSPLVAVYDACVLYPFQLRNLLVQCAADRLVLGRSIEALGRLANKVLVGSEPEG